MDRAIKHRNIFLVYFFSVITLGAYLIYWSVSTKRDINSLGGEVPTTWINLIPFAGFYWVYKYCQGFAEKVKKDQNTMLYFCLNLLLYPVIPAIVQSQLNKMATVKPHVESQKKAA